MEAAIEYIEGAAALSISEPKPKSRLIIGGNECLILEVIRKRPNAWWRLWQYLLFGFKWEVIDGE